MPGDPHPLGRRRWQKEWIFSFSGSHNSETCLTSANQRVESIPLFMANSGQNTGGCSRVSFSFSLVLSCYRLNASCIWFCAISTILPHCLLGSEFLCLFDFSIVIIDPSALQLKAQLGSCHACGIFLMLLVNIWRVQIRKWMFLEVPMVLFSTLVTKPSLQKTHLGLGTVV